MKKKLIGLRYARFRVTPGRVALPDVCCDLIHADGRLLLAGPNSRARPVPILGGGEVHLVAFDAASVREALGIPIDEIVDRIVPLADIALDLAKPLSGLFAAGKAASLVTGRLTGSRPSLIGCASELLSRGADVRIAADY